MELDLPSENNHNWKYNEEKGLYRINAVEENGKYQINGIEMKSSKTKVSMSGTCGGIE